MANSCGRYYKMKSIIKNTIKNHAHSFFFSRKSYAQEGEDLVVDRLLEGKKSGFYVDVGCHHPFRFSNTYLFYKKNWSGICIDPLPGTAELFRKWRPRDKVIEMGISASPSNLTYYVFNEPALNTFDPSLAKERDGLRTYKIDKKIKIRTDTLAAILDQYNAPSDIDFMSIDAEGLDLEVLKSNNWQKYRPKLVIAECFQDTLKGMATDPICVYLETQGYVAYAKTGNSIVFQQKKRNQT